MPDISLADQIRCVEREIGQRERVYPRLVERGSMTRQAMEREIATMKAVLASLREFVGEPDKPNDLFAPPRGVRWA